MVQEAASYASAGNLDVSGTLPGPVTVAPTSTTFNRLVGSGTIGDVTVNARFEPGERILGDEPHPPIQAA